MLGKRAKERESRILEYAKDNSPFNIFELVNFCEKSNENTTYFTVHFVYETSVYDLWNEKLLRLDHNCPKKDKWEITNLGIKEVESL